MKNIRYCSLLLLCVLCSIVHAQKDLSIVKHSLGTEFCRFDSITFGNIHQYPIEVQAESSLSFFDVVNDIVQEYSAPDILKSQISGTSFMRIESNKPSGAATFNSYCQRPGGKYDVYATFVPDYFTQEDITSISINEDNKVFINEEEVQTYKHKVRATLTYWDPETQNYVDVRSDYTYYDGVTVESVCLFQDLELPMLTFDQEYNTYNLHDNRSNGITTLQLYSCLPNSTDKKNGGTYAMNYFCIDKIFFVPKADAGTGSTGLTLYSGNKVLGIPQACINDIKVGGIDMYNTKAIVNPIDFTDVTISHKIDGIGFLLQEGATPSFGVELTSMKTTDARGIVYSTDDCYNNYSPFYNFNHYSNLPMDEQNGTITTEPNAVIFNQILPALLPNSTVGYVPYITIGDAKIYGDTCYFHTPKITAELLNVKVTQPQDSSFCSIEWDATALESGMKRIKFPENPAAPNYVGHHYVPQRDYCEYGVDCSSTAFTQKEERVITPEEADYYNRHCNTYLREDTLANGQYTQRRSFTRREPSGNEYLNLRVSLPDFSYMRNYNVSANNYVNYPYDYYFSNDAYYALCYDVVAKTQSEDVSTAQFVWQNPSDDIFKDASSTLYTELQRTGEFTNYLRLTRDADVLKVDGKTLEQHLNASKIKTLAVADDQAWNKFYARNAQLPATDYWHNATSYDKLTKQQKNELAWNGLMDYPVEASLMSATDETANTIGQSILRDNMADGIFHFSQQDDKIVASNQQAAFITYTNEYLQQHNITAEDYRIITGHERTQGDININNARIAECDGVCSNGYLNVTDDVVTPYAAMDEIIRNNGQSDIFAHILDRWSHYDINTIATQNYKELYGGSYQVYTRRYSPQDAYVTHLSFDPSLSYAESDTQNSSDRQDIHAMYIPTDEAMMQFFSPAGAGWPMYRTYVLKKGTDEEVAYSAPTTKQELCTQLDQIPNEVFIDLINYIMFRRMSESVPSKMTTVRGYDGGQVFKAEDRNHVVGAQQACNGVVYYTDKVYGPGDLTSVLSPLYVGTDSNIMKWVLYNGSNSGETNLMYKDYYAFFKNTDGVSFFSPSDEALRHYYYTLSFCTQRPSLIEWAYTSSGVPPFTATFYEYDTATGTVGAKYIQERIDSYGIVANMSDIVESSTILSNSKQNINSNNEYFETFSGDIVKVKRQNGNIVSIQGGFQILNEKTGITGTDESKGLQQVNVTEQVNANNGTTYIVDSPIIPSPRSAYDVLSTDPEFSEFFNLCNVDEQLIYSCGILGEWNTTSERQQLLKNMVVFINNYSPSYNVSFFDNNPYTLYVPTNAALQQAYGTGLPKWEDIAADYESCVDEYGSLNHADSIRIQGKIDKIMRVVKAHFHFDHAIADKEAYTETYRSPYIYDNLASPFIKVSCQGNGQLAVTDNTGKTCHVTDKKNIIVRDVVCNKTPNNRTLNGAYKVAHSCGIIHQIDGVLGIK